MRGLLLLVFFLGCFRRLEGLFMRCFCVLTELVSLPEAGQGGVQASALLLVGTELLQQLTHLLLTHVQQPLQGHLAWAHLLQNTVDNRGI